MPLIHPLPPAERFDQDMVVGLVPFAEEGTTDAMPVPSVAQLLRGTGLTVPAPRGEISERAPSRALRELDREFGGWFAEDLSAYISLHSSLAPAEEREGYRRAGVSIAWDQPRNAFYSLAFRAGDWQVQAAGDAGAFHCVFLGRQIAADRVLGEGGHPRPQPLGPVAPVLVEAMPRVDPGRYTDRSASHAPNVFDLYLEKRGSIVKAGVRLASDGRYFYGIRVQIAY